MESILLYSGSLIILLWGIGHLYPTKNIIDGFGVLSPDNRKIITMEWIAEGLTLIFLGSVVFLFAVAYGISDPATRLIARLTAAMLFALAILSSFTGAKTSVLPMKLCPFVKSLTAILYILATVL